MSNPVTTTATASKTAKRIYSVIDMQAPDTRPRLVNASSQAQAIHYVVQLRYAAEVASQSVLVQMLTAGVKVEEVGNE